MMEDTADARHRRKLAYNHPSSKQRRADDAAEQRGIDADPIASLRVRHRAEVDELGQKHHSESAELQLKHLQRRATDDSVRNVNVAPPRLLEQEHRERQALRARHTAERAKMLERHKKAMSAARDQHKAWAE